MSVNSDKALRGICRQRGRGSGGECESHSVKGERSHTTRYVLYFIFGMVGNKWHCLPMFLLILCWVCLSDKRKSAVVVYRTNPAITLFCQSDHLHTHSHFTLESQKEMPSRPGCLREAAHPYSPKVPSSYLLPVGPREARMHTQDPALTHKSKTHLVHAQKN